jgi:hypothetical protein
VDNKVWTERPFEANINLSDGTYSLKAFVTDIDGATFDREIKIGVNKPWDWTPSPTPTMVPTLGPTIAPTPTSVTIAPTIVPTVAPLPTSI